jgi:hypothetical protein
MNSPNPITRESFEAWLFSQPDDRVFLFTSCTSCVVASFLKETTSYNTPIVTDKYFMNGSNIQTERNLPEWLVILLEKVRLVTGKYSNYILIRNLKKVYTLQFPLDSNLDPSSSNELKEIEPIEGEKTNPSIANTLAVVS